MISKVTEGIWKISLDSNAYYLEFCQALIDAGNRADRQQFNQLITKIVEPGAVKRIIFTHLHYDHIGNFDLFPNASLFTSEKEIECWKKDPQGTILNDDLAEKFRNASLQPIESDEELEIISTPGHTAGSICIWYAKEKILFSGDTIFNKGLGRTDLPTSQQSKMHSTVMKLLNYNHKILCPGHDY